MPLLVCGCGKAVNTPAPPQPILSQAYPEVAEFLNERHADVLARSRSDDAWGRYAMALDAHEYHNEAIVCYETAIELAPQRPRWKYLLALRFLEQSPERAADLLRQVSLAERPSLSALIRYIDLTSELGSREEVERAVALAETRFPDHPATLFRKARMLFESGSDQEALQLLKQAPSPFRETVALQTRIEAKLFGIANASQLAADELPGTDEDIEDSDREAVASSRRDPLWQGRMAAEHAQAGDPKALETLSELVTKYPELSDNRLLLAIVLQKKADSAKAQQVLKQGLTLDPTNARFLGELGAIAITEARWSDAETWLRTLLQHHPENAGVRGDLAYVVEQSGRRDEALTLLNEALQQRPNDTALLQRKKNLENSYGVPSKL